MGYCALCGSKTGVFSHKIYEGEICSECFRHIPASISLKDTDEHFLRRMKERSEEQKKLFEPTAFYGALYLDSTHGMLCYSEKGKNGSPLMFGDIYKITELKEIGLSCCNVRDTNGRCVDVRCDVRLIVTTEEIRGDYIIARNKKCVLYDKGQGKFECNDPAELAMIRNMLKQMIDDVCNGLNQKVREMQILQELASKEPEKPKFRQDTEWAKGILFLENEDCSEETVKKRYRELCHFYHPDIHPEMSDDYIKKLNKAYEILTG